MDLTFQDSRVLEITSVPRTVSFFFYSPKEINEVCSSEIFCPVFFDTKGKTIEGGLLDENMGTVDVRQKCKFCSLHFSFCTGHPGFIDLAIPIANPLIKNLFKSILKSKCWYCNFFRICNWKTKLFFLKIMIMKLEILENKKKFEKLIKKFIFNKNCKNRVLFKNHRSYISKIKKINTLIRHLYFNDDCKVIKENNSYNTKGKVWSGEISKFIKVCKTEKFCKKCRRSDLNYFSFDDIIDSSPWQVFSENIRFFSFSKNSSIKEKIIKKKLTKKSYIIGKYFNRNISCFQLKQQIEILWSTEKDFCELAWGSIGDSNRFKSEEKYFIFFLDLILVPPSRFRPIFYNLKKKTKNNLLSNPMNYFLTKIIKINQQILLTYNNFKQNLEYNLIMKFYLELEKNFCLYYDSSLIKKNKNNPIGIKQQLEKKNGLFRMHLMGKRSFHTCRSTIVPDPYISGNQVILPLKFTKTLKIPDIMNTYSFRKNFGQNKHIRSNRRITENRIFEDYFGNNLNLLRCDRKNIETQLVNICYRYFFYKIHNTGEEFGLNFNHRNIRDNDILILNRQPTLHRVSIMSHFLKILPGSNSIKLNYMNCNSYNADFDGDEMNIHVPQNIMAIAESFILAIASNNYKVPTNSAPIRGLIQDYIISAIEMSNKDFFLDSKNFSYFQNTIINTWSIEKFFPIPAILKPNILWTGKQIFDSIMQNTSRKFNCFFLESRTKFNELAFAKDETKIMIRNGFLHRGIFDSSQLGKNRHGILNAVYEKLGHDIGEKFLFNLNLVLNDFQRSVSHTTGLADLIFKTDLDKQRIRVLKRKKRILKYLTRKITSKHGICCQFQKDSFKNYKFLISLKTFFIVSGYLIDYLIIFQKIFLSELYSKNIESCIPGALEKKLIDNGFAKMTSSGAKGSSLNVFQICLQLGQIELEGKCIARVKYGKTLPAFDSYDISPEANGFVFQRFLTGILPIEYFFHCMAAREGLLDTAIKTSQSGYIQRSLVKHLESVKISYDLLVKFGANQILQFNFSNDSIDYQIGNFLESLPWKMQNKKIENKKLKSNNFIIGKILNCQKKNDEKYTSVFIKNIDKIPNGYFKKIIEVSEKFRKNYKNVYKKKFYYFQEHCILENFFKSHIQPGSPVGIITSQSIGEPCTQMTLNNFHFAGKINSNINLGIPRLREILLLAAKYPKTPTMSIDLKKNILKKKILQIEKRMKKLSIFDIIESISYFFRKKKNKEKLLINFKISSKNKIKHQFSISKNLIYEKISTFMKKFNMEILKKVKGIKKKMISSKFINFKNTKKKINIGSVEIQEKLNPKIMQQYKEFKLCFYEKIDSKTLDDTILNLNIKVKESSKISNIFVDYRLKKVHSVGLNFFAFWKYRDIFDLNKIMTNDFYGMSVVYGIEAGRNIVLNELENLFKMQNIEVGFRYLNLIADYMTRLGTFRGFSRKNISEESHIQRITYETALSFLIEASLNKIDDNLSTVSGSLIFANPCKLGTGIVNLF
jgi:DNA-directed RNA polymerase I subunit RPA1